MKTNVEERIREITARAKNAGVKSAKLSSAVRNRSSLHRIIKTKEQADRFMKLLRSL